MSVIFAQKFTDALPNTVWNNIYENHMDEESFMPIAEATNKILKSDQPFTQYSEIESLYYNTKQCEIKTMWKSLYKDPASMAFQKGSPMVPFFKHAYNKLRQTGTLYRIQEKWRQTKRIGKCGANSLRPISLKKIISIIVLLLMGISIAFLVCVVEFFYMRRTEFTKFKCGGKRI